MSGFDLDAATAVIAREEAGRVVHVKDEAGQPLYDGDNEVTLTVVGSYSKRYQQAHDAMLRRVQNRQDIEDSRKDLVGLHAQCVIAWAGFYEAGQPLDCTPANVQKVLRAAPWIHNQVIAAMEDHAGFSVGSSEP